MIRYFTPASSEAIRARWREGRKTRPSLSLPFASLPLCVFALMSLLPGVALIALPAQVADSQPVRSVGKPYNVESKPSDLHNSSFYRHLPLISGVAPSLKTQERRKLLRSCYGILRASWTYPTLLSAQVVYYKHFTTACSSSTACWHAGSYCIVTVEQNNK
jgi:hypothetical protein